MLVKIYGKTPEGGEVRYSPAQCMGGAKDRSFLATLNLTMFDQLYRTSKPYDAYVHASVY